MNVEEFAARRRDQFVAVDERLAPVVAEHLDAREWAPMVDAAAAIFLEIFTEEAPDAYPDRAVEDFRADIERSLRKTSTASSVQRTTTWLGTYTVNSATYHGNRARGGRRMRWVTMHDESVRKTHRAADGQIVSVNGTFDVGGHRLRFPGEPVGPPEIWIECRCVVAGGRVRAMAAVTAAVELPEDEEEVVDEETIEEEDLVDDELEEVPVHGVAAPVGVRTGDGRQFSKLRNRDLPLPIAYQTMTGDGGHVNSVTVGRIDRIEYAETPAGTVARYWGAIIPTRAYANEVLEGIVDGTVRGVSVDVDDVIPDPEHEAKRSEILNKLMAEDSEITFDDLTDEERDIMQLAVFDARIAGLTVVAIPAFQEAYIGLGHEFMEDERELTDEESAALAACGCSSASASLEQAAVVDLSVLTDAELATYDGLPDEDARDAWLLEHHPEAILTAGTRESLMASGGIVTGSTFAIIGESGREAYRSFPAAERKKLAGEGKAMPDGSFPIENEEDLKNAIQAIGRAKDPDAAKAHIKKRARALGKTDLIPEDWALLIGEHGDQLQSWVVVGQEFAPGTKDGPGWITHPRATARIRRYWVRGAGAAKIKWGAPGDFNRCRRQLAKYVRNPEWLAGLCANMHKEALGFWPAQHKADVAAAVTAGATPAPMFNLVAGAGNVLPAEAFRRPDALTEPTGVVIDGDRIFGYVATWGVCHIGIPGRCETAPRSASNYAYFRTGTVQTDEGEIPVGQITMGTGHASLKASAVRAAEHYDHTGAAVADVATGEDTTGIWFAGMLRPSATEEQRRALAASGRLSGDWRRIGGQLEMVAALAVNVPGFPIPRAALAASAEHVDTVLAMGVVEDEPAAVVASAVLDDEMVASIARASVQEYIRETDRQQAVAATQEARRAVRSEHLANLRSQIGME